MQAAKTLPACSCNTIRCSLLPLQCRQRVACRHPHHSATARSCSTRADSSSHCGGTVMSLSNLASASSSKQPGPLAQQIASCSTVRGYGLKHQLCGLQQPRTSRRAVPTAAVSGNLSISPSCSRAAQRAASPDLLSQHFRPNQTTHPSSLPASQPRSSSSSGVARQQRGGPAFGLGGPDAVQTVMVGGSVVVAASMAFFYGFKVSPTYRPQSEPYLLMSSIISSQLGHVALVAHPR